MGFQNLYYYSWYPEVNTTANSEVPNISSPAASRVVSNWTEKLPGKNILVWILLAFLVILIGVIGYVALGPSTVSQDQPLEQPSATNDIPVPIDLIFEGNDTEGENNHISISENVTSELPAPASDDLNCPLGQLKCNSTGKCTPISAYCDAGSDCFGCPCTDASFQCNQSGRNMSSDCIPLQLVCDGRVDCRGTRRDEDHCITLSKSSNFHNFDLGLVESTTSEGFVLVRMKGIWHPYCSNDWSMNLFRSICHHLGFGTLVNPELQDLNKFHSKMESLTVDDQPKLVIRSSEANGGEEAEWDSCKIAYLRCIS